MKSNTDFSSIKSIVASTTIDRLKDKNENDRDNAGKRKKKDNTAKRNNSDKIIISPLGETMSVIENLRKQKEDVRALKNALIEESEKNGVAISDISAHVEMYNMLLENIEYYISQAIAKEKEEEIIANENQVKTYGKSARKNIEKNTSVSNRRTTVEGANTSMKTAFAKYKENINNPYQK